MLAIPCFSFLIAVYHTGSFILQESRPVECIADSSHTLRDLGSRKLWNYQDCRDGEEVVTVGRKHILSFQILSSKGFQSKESTKGKPSLVKHLVIQSYWKPKD